MVLSVNFLGVAFDLARDGGSKRLQGCGELDREPHQVCVGSDEDGYALNGDIPLEEARLCSKAFRAGRRFVLDHVFASVREPILRIGRERKGLF